MKTRILCIFICALSVILGWQAVAGAIPAGNGFTYNGRLEQNNNPPTGFFDFEFALFDDPNGIEGSQVSGILFFDHLRVHKGSFNARLDFGKDAFDGNARWLLISVRDDNENDPNAFEDLLPLVQLTPAPYALYANKIAGKELSDLIQQSEPNSIDTGMVTKGSITKEKIGNGAVSREKLENGAVNSAKIENGAVGQDKIGNGAINSSKIENKAVGQGQLNDKAVGQGQLNDKAVGQGQLGDKAVGRGQLGNKAVGKGQIDDAAIDPNKLEDGAVTTAKLGDISGYQLSSSYIGFLMSLENTDISGGYNGHALSLKSTDGIALRAESSGSITTSGGYGVYAQNTNDGVGVYGYSLAGRALWGFSDGTTGDGYGVYGENKADGTGVYGYSQGGTGVHGRSESATGYGVHADNPSGGWAARFDGKTAVTEGLFVTDSGPVGNPLEALHVKGKIYLNNMDPAIGGGYTVRYESNRLVIQTSSEKYKDNIQPMHADHSRILQAQAKSFTWKGTDNKDIGFIAEEFHALGLNDLVIYKDGKPDGVRYEMVPLYLLETTKDMAETTVQLKQENELLKQQIRSLREAVEDLKSSMAREVE